jgi:glycosyltransferase involved in cell wall biosynthesis
MERAFAELIRRIHDRYDVVVFSSELGEDLRPLVEWRRVPVPRRPVPLRFGLFYLLGAARLAATDVEVVHTLGAIVPNAAQLASVHFCFAGFVNAAGRLAPSEAPLLRRLNTGVANLFGLLAERWSYRSGRVEWLAPVSQGLARELADHYPGPAVRLTPNGVDRERFHPDEETRAQVRRGLGVAADDFLALFVGGDWHRKGLGIAIDAVAEAALSCEHRIRLVVVGRGEEAHFQRLAEERAIGELVAFAGPRADAERFYAAADAFVLPSIYETFSLAAFEAAASRLPIVATRVSGVEELVGDGAAGFLVERDARQIAAALAQLASSADLRQRLGEAAHERSSAYTWDRSVRTVEAIYGSLTDGHAPLTEAVGA